MEKDMKQRMLVMNGQCILQGERQGEWRNEKVGKAGALTAGIYNLYMAKAADKEQTYEGKVVHVDDEKVYQQIGKSFVFHESRAFDSIPEVGSIKKIGYDGAGKAAVAEKTAADLKRYRGR